MEGSPQNPIIVQSDRTIFLEVDHPQFQEARDRLMAFAELEKSPERVHIYRLTPMSLWNAAAAGWSAEAVLDFLRQRSKYPVPAGLRKEVADIMGRFGLLKLTLRSDGDLDLTSSDPLIIEEIRALKYLADYFVTDALPETDRLAVRARYRGQIKVALIKLGYPVQDLAGYRSGSAFSILLAKT